MIYIMNIWKLYRHYHIVTIISSLSYRHYYIVTIISSLSYRLYHIDTIISSLSYRHYHIVTIISSLSYHHYHIVTIILKDTLTVTITCDRVFRKPVFCHPYMMRKSPYSLDQPLPHKRELLCVNWTKVTSVTALVSRAKKAAAILTAPSRRHTVTIRVTI